MAAIQESSGDIFLSLCSFSASLTDGDRGTQHARYDSLLVKILQDILKL